MINQSWRSKGLNVSARFQWACCVLLGALVLTGCQKEAALESGGPLPESSPQPQPALSAEETKEPQAWTEERVHQALREANPGYNGQAMFQLDQGQVIALQLSGTGTTNLAPLRSMSLKALDLRQTEVTDLTPLNGLPLLELYLEQAPVRDLAPLRGMKLAKLYLSQTKVVDLSPLQDMPLVELNLLGTGVQDLAPLSRLPLEMLWLNETPVADITPLRSCPLVSLTLHRTQVRDLSPLSGTRLQRLHIGETPVTDLTPIKGLPLTRLVFSPNRIAAGLDTVRQMAALREMGPTLESVMPPARFWELYDQGAFK